MKEMLEFVKLSIAHSSPLLLIVATIVTFFALYKTYKDISKISHSIRGRNLDVFIDNINDNVIGKERIRLEKSFEQLYKRLISYQEIRYLLAFDSPSTSIRDYLWGTKYLKFDFNINKIEYRKQYWFRAKEILLIALMILSIGMSYISLVVFAATAFSTDIQNRMLINSGIVFLLSVFLVWCSLYDARSLSAAKRIAEKSSEIAEKSNEQQEREEIRDEQLIKKT